MTKEIPNQEDTNFNFVRADITRRFEQSPDAVVGKYGITVITKAEERPN